MEFRLRTAAVGGLLLLLTLSGTGGIPSPMPSPVLSPSAGHQHYGVSGPGLGESPAVTSAPAHILIPPSLTRSDGPLRVSQTVTFSTPDLPCCWEWYVTMNGVTLGTGDSSQFFRVGDGSYNYSVQMLLYYLPSPASGVVKVNGSDVRVSISFYSPMTYPVFFNETGLRGGSPWSVVVAFGDVPGGSLAWNLTYASQSILLRDGSYTFQVSGPPPYGISGKSGNLVVTGRTLYEHVVFYPGRYTVTFHTFGLSNGTSWSVVANDSLNRTTGNSIVFHLNDGVYAYGIGMPSGFVAVPASGKINVSGSDLGVPIQISPFLFHVVVQESGLPTGTQWSASFGGKSSFTGSNELDFGAPNGSSNLSIFNVPGYRTNAYSRSVDVQGIDVLVLIIWNVTTFVTRFVESGLPPGTLWAVNVNDRPLNGSLTEIDAMLANGTGAFTVQPPAGYSSNPSNGTLFLQGNGTTIRVNFTHLASSPWLFQNSLVGIPNYASLMAFAAILLAVAAVILSRRRRARLGVRAAQRL